MLSSQGIDKGPALNYPKLPSQFLQECGSDLSLFHVLLLVRVAKYKAGSQRQGAENQKPRASRVRRVFEKSL
jgi:hypothetical protein